MPDYFSEKFKTLRKAKDLTQDQIADIFHVSPQAVSRWETGANYPDIEILPHIAGFFKVTVDELLGTALILGEEKAKEYERDIRNLMNSGKLDDAIDLAHKAIKEYPLRYTLQALLIQALCAACTEESPEKHKEEIIAVGERAMKYCTDQTKCEWIKWQLIRQYAKWGMKAEAKMIVDTLPKEAYYTQELTLCYALEGEAWRKNQRWRISRFTYMLCDLLLRPYVDEAGLDALQKIKWLKAIMQIGRMSNEIIEDDDDDDFGYAFENVELAELYCEAGDKENAIRYVEKAVPDAMRHIDVMDQTNEDGFNGCAWPTRRNMCWILWEDSLMKPQFDLIRDDARFIKCFEMLQAHSNELK